MEQDKRFLAEISSSAKKISNIFAEVRPNRKRKKIAQTASFILNNSLLVDISGITWEVKDGQLCPIFLPPFFDEEGNIVQREEHPKGPSKPSREEDMSTDDPRASIYVQGRFDVGPNGDITVSTKRVPTTIFKILDKPKDNSRL